MINGNDQILGRLEPVDLRAAWADEAREFTPWLAQPENIALLGETIGLDLEVESTEKSVGPFSADILCRVTDSDASVLIENQLEKTNHTHLGQIITYAAGLNVGTVIWIARHIREEHRAALDWLNEITGEAIHFFAIQVELYRIGDSPLAPRFNVVSKPNDWAKTVRAMAEQAGAGELSETQQLQFEFWQGFKEAIEDDPVLRLSKPYPSNYVTMPIGRSGFHLSAVASTWNSQRQSYDEDDELRAMFLIQDKVGGAQYFGELEARRAEIEKAFGGPLIWDGPENRRSKHIYVRRDADLADRGAWAEYHHWLKGNLGALHRVFSPLVKDLRVLS